MPRFARSSTVNLDLVAAIIPPEHLPGSGEECATSKLDAVMVENALANVVRADPGVAYVFTRTRTC